MGFASYFEDIRDREIEAEDFGRAVEQSLPVTRSVVGIRGSACAPLPPRLPRDFAAHFEQLRQHLIHVRSNVVEGFRESGWQRLSTEMDRLEREANDFERKTLFAGERQILARANSISESLESVLRRAGVIIAYLEPHIQGIAVELQAIRQLRRQFGTLTMPKGESELERSATQVIDGWWVLVDQTQQLEERADQLKPVIAGKAFERMCSKPGFEVIDKDGMRDEE